MTIIDLKINKIQKLISINETNFKDFVKDFDIYFEISGDDPSKEYEIVFVDSKMLEDSENIVYKKVIGSINGNIITDLSNKEYFLLARNLGDDDYNIKCNITFKQKVDIPYIPTRQQEQQEQQEKKYNKNFIPDQIPPLPLNQEEYTFTSKYKFLIIILIIGLIIYLSWSIYKTYKLKNSIIPTIPPIPTINSHLEEYNNTINKFISSPSPSSFSGKSFFSKSDLGRSPSIDNNVIKNIKDLLGNK